MKIHKLLATQSQEAAQPKQRENSQFVCQAYYNHDATLTWDAENRLVTIAKTNGQVINYQYDAMHRRIRKITSGQQTVFGTMVPCKL